MGGRCRDACSGLEAAIPVTLRGGDSRSGAVKTWLSPYSYDRITLNCAAPVARVSASAPRAHALKKVGEAAVGDEEPKAQKSDWH